MQALGNDTSTSFLRTENSQTRPPYTYDVPTKRIRILRDNDAGATQMKCS